MTVRAHHERPALGPAADFAESLAVLLPHIETETLILRAPRIEDFEVYAEIVARPEGRFLIDQPTRENAWFDFAQMTATWLLRGHGVWTVVCKADRAVPMGFVLIGFEPGDHEPELGYMFREVAEGFGFAFEAARAARDHAFTAMDLPTLVSTVDPENLRSRRLAEKLGGVRDACAEAAHHNETLVYRYQPQRVPEHA
ncbi:MAG: GNAT family N-acetyltransferase [Pseudomonadota bacterium]